MSVMYTDVEAQSLSYHGSRMELVRATTGPSYDTPPSYVARLACRAAALAPTPRDLGAVLATVRRWQAGRPDQVEIAELSAVVAARPFTPNVTPAMCPYV
jgi:hypothetical protein